MPRGRVALPLDEWKRRLWRLESIETAALPEADRNKIHCRRYYARKRLRAAGAVCTFCREPHPNDGRCGGGS